MNDVIVNQNLVTIKILRYNLSDIKNGAVSKRVESALQDGSLTVADLQKKIVFDSLCEGHGVREMSAILNSLRHYKWYDPRKIIFLHNSLDPIPASIKNIAWPWYMINHSDWLHNLQNIAFDWDSHGKDQWFVCLMRRRSEQRSRFLRKILDNFDRSQCQLSYASMIDYRAFDDIAQVEIPMLLDGPTPGNEQHRARDPRIFGCLINVIAETSCQEPGGHYWSSRFITEKTFKCFGWRQIPIWFAAPGIVRDVRNLGFDVFDDIINHDCYDGISDPVCRMTAVVGTLKNFIESRSDTPDDVYRSVRLRLEKNWQRLLELDRQKLPYWATIMEQIHEL